MNKISLKKKIVLGSANFTQKYGVKYNKVKLQEIKKILNLAKKNNIYKIDTADVYLKNSSFFQYSKNEFKIFTKIKPDSKWISFNYCKKKLKNQIKKYDNSTIETLLFHDVKILFTKVGSKIFDNLEQLKQEGFFEKIGISIYDTNCLKYLISKFKIDVVQCPYNILDKRIIYSGWFKRLKKKKIEIHVRSIFLQGLLVNEKLNKKNYFKEWEIFFLKWFNFLQYNKISPINYCLNDLLSHNFDQIIIGINSRDDLKEILNFKLMKNKDKLYDFAINDLKLIDPRNWK
jgi:aryl-alcohol dehydrogenase-like predicted oxidoreductase